MRELIAKGEAASFFSSCHHTLAREFTIRSKRPLPRSKDCCYARWRLGTRQALEEAIGTAISTIGAQDAQGFFEHCGYRPRVQLLAPVLYAELKRKSWSRPTTFDAKQANGEEG